jgi:hypothetical protein
VRIAKPPRPSAAAAHSYTIPTAARSGPPPQGSHRPKAPDEARKDPETHVAEPGRRQTSARSVRTQRINGLRVPDFSAPRPDCIPREDARAAYRLTARIPSVGGRLVLTMAGTAKSAATHLIGLNC